MSGNGILKSTTVVLILIGAVFGLVSCTGVSQEEFDRISKDLDVARTHEQQISNDLAVVQSKMKDIETERDDARTMLAGYAAEPEITQAGTALLSAIANWHLRWGEPGLTGFEREDMVSELIDLAEPAGDLLEEPLIKRMANYTANHMLYTMVGSNTAFRAALFGVGSGLGDSMLTPCSLPETNTVPEEFQQDLSLLISECQTMELFEIYISQTRSLAAETWLRPFIDRLLAP